MLSGYVIHCQSSHYCTPIDEARIEKTLRDGSHATNAVICVMIVFTLGPTRRYGSISVQSLVAKADTTA